MALTLYGYYRSGTTYRTRIALNFKGVSYESISVDLRAGAHREAAFKALNPQAMVPALKTPEGLLTQSPAILEWIEETWPNPPLLPAEPFARAQVRAFSMAIACDIHPIQNLRILKAVKAMSADEGAPEAWARHWIETGFGALERLAEAGGGSSGFLFADGPSLAEVYLLPQLYNARRFQVDLAPYPRLCAAEAAAGALPAFAAAHPDRQPDAPAP